MQMSSIMYEKQITLTWKVEQDLIICFDLRKKKYKTKENNKLERKSKFALVIEYRRYKFSTSWERLPLFFSLSFGWCYVWGLVPWKGNCERFNLFLIRLISDVLLIVLFFCLTNTPTHTHSLSLSLSYLLLSLIINLD